MLQRFVESRATRGATGVSRAGESIRSSLPGSASAIIDCMYFEHFALKQLPFSLSPDPRFVYWSRKHARCRDWVQLAIAQPHGAAILAGGGGVGKTLMLETFVQTCPKDVVVARVNQPPESVEEFLQAVLTQFADPAPGAQQQELSRTFDRFLAEQHAMGRTVLLAVDEAHRLSRPVLTSILNPPELETPHAGSLRVVVAGQFELDDLSTSTERERPALRAWERLRLSELSRDEVRPYVEHRLEVAGAGGRSIFQPKTFDAIYRHSGGTPRLINMLCDAAMVVACMRNCAQVSPAEINDAIGELQWEDRSTAPDRAAAAPDRAPAALAPAAATHLSHEPGHVSGVASDEPLAKLLVAYQGNTVAELDLTHGRARIGRSPENDLQIASEFVSRHHCDVLTTAEASIIEDVSSTNGIYLNDKRVRRHRLRDGDVLIVGDHELRYAEQRHSKARST